MTSLLYCSRHFDAYDKWRQCKIVAMKELLYLMVFKQACTSWRPAHAWFLKRLWLLTPIVGGAKGHQITIDTNSITWYYQFLPATIDTVNRSYVHPTNHALAHITRNNALGCVMWKTWDQWSIKRLCTDCWEVKLSIRWVSAVAASSHSHISRINAQCHSSMVEGLWLRYQRCIKWTECPADEKVVVSEIFEIL